MSATAICRRSWPAASRRLNFIPIIPEQPVIEKILTHLGLQARATPRAPRRGPHLQTAQLSGRPSSALVHLPSSSDLKIRIDILWTVSWTSGITNPLAAIEQITFLTYSRLPDMQEREDEQRASVTGTQPEPLEPEARPGDG